MKKAVVHFKDYLKQNGLRITKQREVIVDLFLAQDGHLCVDELYYALRKKYPNIGYVTVYRTLKLLKDAGMVSEVNFTGKMKRFEHSFGQPHHDHFVCQKCGKIIEFVDEEIERKQKLLCGKYRFKGERHLMQIFGLCRDCQKGEA